MENKINMENKEKPAYPAIYDASDMGLTKRELFAMSAMQGILSSGHWYADNGAQHIALYSITYADSLLKALEDDKTK